MCGRNVSSSNTQSACTPHRACDARCTPCCGWKKASPGWWNGGPGEVSQLSGCERGAIPHVRLFVEGEQVGRLHPQAHRPDSLSVVLSPILDLRVSRSKNKERERKREREQERSKREGEWERERESETVRQSI